MEDTIKKDALKIKPNLENYEQAYKKFKWEDAEKYIEFFEDGKLNAAYNAVTRHAKNENKDKAALIWLGENLREERYTFERLDNLSNKFGNLLKKLEVEKGDRVFVFLPRIPQLYISFLGILKIGAIAGTLFSAFGSTGLKDRLENSGAKAVITTKELKPRIDEIRKDLPELKYVILADTNDTQLGEISYDIEMKDASEELDIEHMDKDDYSYMLYTSGTTGKSKGVAHTHYDIVQGHLTTSWILDLHKEDIYWCTADPGWVTGIVYGILGPLSNAVTSIVFEGKFTAESWYGIIQKYKVTVWYTAPTAIRMLMAQKDANKKFDLSSLRYLASVGEPLNPEAVHWSVKELSLPFHDNWWQTETGGILIANYPCMPIKPGSMGKPFPGITAAIVDDSGKEMPLGEEGNLAIKPGWPSMMKTIWKNEEKYKSCFKDGWYITGDRAMIDKDGYFWFIGRADDVIKTAGHRVGPFEVESALVEHEAIAEAGVIGKPDPMFGEIIKAFITLKPGFKKGKELEDDIKNFIKAKLAGHAYPKEMEFVDKLPKTRSGKIMRRMLKAKEMGQPIGDTSTLED